MNKEFESFREFWPFYVCEHSKPLTRGFHFIGTATIFPLFYAAVNFYPYLVFLIPVTAYGFAWFSHFCIEKNKPATFRYPQWSLAGDFKMFGLMIIGKMDKEFELCRKSGDRDQSQLQLKSSSGHDHV